MNQNENRKSMKYYIPILWESYKRIPVEADNLQDAVIKALKQFLSEPDDNYLDDSFEIDNIIKEEHPDEVLNMDDVYNELFK